MTLLSITPHDLNLTVVAIIIVFGALLILYILYSAFGALFIEGEKRRRHLDSRREEAESSRCELRSERDMAAAIAVALYLEEEKGECGKITFNSRESAWADKTLLFRKNPAK